MPLLQPQHPQSSLGWKGFPDTCPGAAAEIPQNQGRWRAAAAHGGFSRLFPFSKPSGCWQWSCRGSCTLGIAQMFTTTQGIKSGKITLVLGWEPIYLHLPHPCALHQPGAATGPTETALSPGTTIAGQIGCKSGQLCPHCPSCSLWDKHKKPAQPQHLPGTQNHSRTTQEKRGWALTISWPTGQPWRGLTFPLQLKSPAAPHQELQHKVCLLQTLLHWHQQEPLSSSLDCTQS